MPLVVSSSSLVRKIMTTTVWGRSAVSPKLRLKPLQCTVRLDKYRPRGFYLSGLRVYPFPKAKLIPVCQGIILSVLIAQQITSFWVGDEIQPVDLEPA